MGIGAMSRPAVFLDRDGVLVEEIFYAHTGEREAPLAAEDVRLLPGVAAGVAAPRRSRLRAGRDFQPGRLRQRQDHAARAVARA